VQVLHGDCREIMASLPEASVDAIVCDPPYEIAFMGRKWDASGIAFDPATWAAALRVLKPGGHLVAFGGGRTYHRMTCAIEDAGFEIRDCLYWAYGSGFPKSHDVSKGIDKAAGAERTEIISERKGVTKTFNVGANEVVKLRDPITAPATDAARQWQGWGTALKPAIEPAVPARKPLGGRTVAENVLMHGTGALNIGACRVGDEVRYAAFTSLAPCRGNRLGDADTAAARRGTQGEAKCYEGRWPANLCHDGSDEVLACFPETGKASVRVSEDRDVVADAGGSAARFFASFPPEDAHRLMYCPKASKRDRAGSKHPTVKPVALMQWLCRLVTPSGGTILDPFAGSGTTGEAARLEGFDAILIEREDEYVADIRRRLEQPLPAVQPAML
jgi:DNA modification methylase